MSTEDISTHGSRQGDHIFHHQHHEHVVRHALRNIPGGKQLCDKVYNLRKESHERLPEPRNDETDGQFKIVWF